MTRHCIKQKPFWPPSSAKPKPAVFSDARGLPLGSLDKISCFETLRAYAGRVFHVQEHLNRLAESCKALGEAMPVPSGELKKWIQNCLKESEWPHALMRLSVHWENASHGRLVLILREFRSHPVEIYEKGVSLRTAVQKRCSAKAQDPQIKASQFVSGVLSLVDERGGRGAIHRAPTHEQIFLGPLGTVAEGSVSNIFIVTPTTCLWPMKQKRLLTPSASSGILRGVTRGIVMELAGDLGIPVVETHLTRHDIYNAEECFLTNTSSEILPVVTVDGRRIGRGRPGKMTQILARKFKAVIADEAKQSPFLPLRRGNRFDEI